MKVGRIAWSIVGLLSLSALARAGPLLIGGTSDGTIYDVDPQTGLASNPRDTGLNYLGGLAFITSSNTLYAVGTAQYPGPQALFTIDPTTGSTHPVGDLALPDAGIIDLSYDRATDQLYGLFGLSGAAGMFLGHVDRSSGSVTDSVFLSRIARWGGLAFSPVGKLLLIDPLAGVLANADPTSGEVSGAVGLSKGAGTGTGLAFSDQGVLFLAGGGLTGTDLLYIVDPATGSMNALGHTGVAGGLGRLAFVPEPATLFLVLLGMLAVGRRRVRRRSWHRFAASFALAALGCACLAHADEGEVGAGGGGIASQVPVGPAPLYTFVGHGNFEVAGSGTRIYLTSTQSLPATDPITVLLKDVPPGATIEKAFVNWSYLTNGTAVARCSSPSRYGLSRALRSLQRGSCIRG